MTVSVIGHPLEDAAVSFNTSEERVATGAQQAANMASNVAMIHEQIALNVADQAPAVLGLAHGFNIFGGQPILSLESGAKILGLRGFGVGHAPFPQSLIATFTVALPVFTVAFARAIATFGTLPTPVGEGVIGEFAGALTASSHVSIMPRNTDTQPCHADVLLEIANA